MVETQRVQCFTVNIQSHQILHQNMGWCGLWGLKSRKDTSENRTAEMLIYSSPVNSSLLFPAYETTPSRPHLALFTCLFLLMSFLGVAMYCTDRRHQQRLCEELEAALAVYLLHMKQLLWGCWIWLTMQWHKQTTGGTRGACYSFPDLFFFPILEKYQAHKHFTLSAVLIYSEWRRKNVYYVASLFVYMTLTCRKAALTSVMQIPR